MRTSTSSSRDPDECIHSYSYHRTIIHLYQSIKETAMCSPRKLPQSLPSQQSRPSIQSILLPIIASLLHLHVFYHALFNYLLFLPHLQPTTPSSVFYSKCYLLERAVFVAYTFDLLCCYLFRIIPFSRCNLSKDIASHHLPILVGVLPLCIPIWAEWKTIDPLVHSILDHTNNTNDDETTKWRYAMIMGVLQANGWGFVSSLNEFIMCLQRAEMNFYGIETFHQLSMMDRNSNNSKKHHGHQGERKKIMTSRWVIGFELYFKFGIFCIFSCFGFKACCSLDKVYYGHWMEVHGNGDGNGANDFDESWKAVKAIVVSPMFIRAVLFRVFMLSMYPMMGWRTIKKIQQFHRDGKGDRKGKQGGDNIAMTKKIR